MESRISIMVLFPHFSERNAGELPFFIKSAQTITNHNGASDVSRLPALLPRIILGNVP